MLALPSRHGLASLADAVNAVAPLVILGFARNRADERSSIVFSQPFGFGEYIVSASDVPVGLRPDAGDVRQSDAEALRANPTGAIEWLLLFGSVERLVSIEIAGIQPTTRFWVGFPDPSALSRDQLMRLESIAQSSARLLNTPRSPEETAEQSRRLECAADLLPALLHVLDVREVFDRLSEIAKRALPHDLVLLRLFNEDLTKITIYARSDRGPELGPTLPHHYPVSVTRAWEFDIIDDYAIHPLEQDRPPAKMGARSALRLPIRFDDRVIGGVGFLSFEPGKYTSADVAIGRRLADQVAVGLSHYRLAEERHHAAALRERAANLEMLDGLLKTLTGVLDIREVFARVSEIAHEVLPHDALSIAEMLPDGETARIHASHGLGALPCPYDVKMPDRMMMTESWNHQLIDDLQALPAYAMTAGAKAGMRSAMYVSIRFEGRLFGGLNFYSRTPGRYVTGRCAGGEAHH
jgi:GAF domain-containing protein